MIETPLHDVLRTSWSTDGKVPPSLNRPHPVTVAFSPMRRSSEPGKHMGTMCCVYLTGESSRTMAKSYSYVKKLYLGWTIFRTTERSTNGYGSWSDEKSYSPTRMRICDVSKLRSFRRIRKRVSMVSFVYFYFFFFTYFLILCMFSTHSSTQWPAVAIQFSFSRAPPHRCVLENPKNDVLRTETCITDHGDNIMKIVRGKKLNSRNRTIICK